MNPLHRVTLIQGGIQQLPSRRKVGPQGQGLRIALARIVMLPLGFTQAAQFCVSLDEVGRQRQGLQVMGFGFRPCPAPLQQVGQVVVQNRFGRRQADRLAVGLLGFICQARLPLRDGHLDQGWHRTGRDGQRRMAMLNGQIDLPAGTRCLGQDQVGRHEPGVALQCLRGQCLGLSMLSGLKGYERQCQKRIEAGADLVG